MMDHWPPLPPSSPEFDTTHWRDQTQRAADFLTRALAAISFVVGGLFSLILMLLAGF